MRIAWPSGVLPAVRDFAPDVVHVHSTGGVGRRGVATARALRRPLVGTDHTLPAHYLHYVRLDYPWAARWVCRDAARFFARCDVVTAPSRAMLDELRAFGWSGDGREISNPIDVDRFRPLPSAECKTAFGVAGPTVLVLGRLAKEKYLDEAFRAFAALSGGPSLLVVGDGPMREWLARFADTLDIASRVAFTGALQGEQLIQAINACDVKLITSRSETQSMTTLQAMACGLPVVAVRAGALPEYVRDGESGRVVECGDIAAMARAVGEALSEDRGRVWGDRGRSIAQAYAPDAVADRWEALYEELMRRS
jgi:glycosyltransferase involved in cell wall biosynthesis